MPTPDPMPDHPEDFDGFSARLRAQPPAALPAHWRAEILAAACQAVPPPALAEIRPLASLVAWLWPHPLAYAALAPVWLLILTLRCTTPSNAPPVRRPLTAAASAFDPEALAREQAAINTVLFASYQPKPIRP